MDPEFDERCDNLDAAVFTGDWLLKEENRAGLRYYLNRWAKEIEAQEEVES